MGNALFGENISMDEIQSIIIKAFGEKRENLTEADLEKIMNTKVRERREIHCR